MKSGWIRTWNLADSGLDVEDDRWKVLMLLRKWSQSAMAVFLPDSGYYARQSPSGVKTELILH